MRVLEPIGDMPSGTVTFLFTDIENSSSQWEAEPHRMASALELHNATIQKSIDTNGGVIVQHTGDGFYAVFARAADCVMAAVDAQGALTDAVWPGDIPLMVRMGMHTGEASVGSSLDDRNYFGPTVNRAARVSDAANGGQIAMSEATVEASGQCGDVSFDFAGVFELKGLGPERMYLALTPDGPRIDRRLRASRVDTGVSRAFANSFVGRRDELLALKKQLQPGRLVSVVGVGGIGKTRMSTQFVSENAHRFAGGVYWLSLGSLEPDADIAPTVLNALGVSQGAGLTGVETVVAALDGSDALLVLDNCEHVQESACELASSFLAADRPPAVLATSRIPFALERETVVHLGPIASIDDALSLFLDRVRDRSPDRVLTSVETDAARQLCERFDGVPLAIELASARVDFLSSGRSEELLAVQLRASSTEPEFQLRSAIEWSYDLLDETLARVFLQLSVFSGTFSIAGAEAVVDPTDDLLGSLLRLADRSLIETEVVDGSMRLRMLGVLREFARPLLIESGRATVIRERHRGFVLKALQEADAAVSSADEVEAWSDILAMWDDIRGAFMGSVDDDDLDVAAEIVIALFYYSGYSLDQEVTEWALRLVDLAAFQGSDRFTSVAGTAAYGLYGRAELEAAYVMGRRGLDRDATDPHGYCRIAAVIAAINLGLVDDAEVLLDDWEQLDQTLHAQVFAHGWRAIFETWLKRSDRGLVEASAALNTANQLGSVSARAAASWIFGNACARVDDPSASEAMVQALEMTDRLPSRHLIRQLAMGALTDISVRIGDQAAAVEHCTHGLRTSLRHGWLISTTHLLGSAAILLVQHGTPELAARLLGSMEATGHTPRPRAARAVQEAVGPRAATLAVLGSQLTLSESVGLAVERLELIALELQPKVA